MYTQGLFAARNLLGMTQWGLDSLFNPAKRHMDEEKRRLQATREEIGDSSGGNRIDLESGKVKIRRANGKVTVVKPEEPTATADGDTVDGDTVDEDTVDEDTVNQDVADEDAVNEGVASEDVVDEGVASEDVAAKDAAAKDENTAE
jgi:hypothetical protein